MTSYHNQPEMYHDHPASRSPGSHRHQPQTLHRQPSRQFDAYGPMPTAPAYATEDPMARYDTGRMDRLNFTHTMHNSQFGTAGQFGYDMGGASTWNPNGNGFPTAATLNPMAATSRMKPPRGRTGIPTVSSYVLSPRASRPLILCIDLARSTIRNAPILGPGALATGCTSDSS